MSHEEDDAPPTKEDVLQELHECARYGEIDDLKMMVEGDDTGPMFNVNGKDATGSSAVHKAAANGHVHMLQYLLELKADYSLNENGVGPLSWAVLNKQAEAVKFLLDNYGSKIDVLAKPSVGKTILSMAYEADDQNVIVMVLKHPSAKPLEEMVPEDSVAEADGEQKAEEMDEEDVSAEPSSQAPRAEASELASAEVASGSQTADAPAPSGASTTSDLPS